MFLTLQEAQDMLFVFIRITFTRHSMTGIPQLNP